MKTTTNRRATKNNFFAVYGALLLLFAIVFLPAISIAATPTGTLTQFVAKYNVENDYITGGRATLSLKKNQHGKYDFILQTKPTGIFKWTGKGNITEQAELPQLTTPFEANSYRYTDKGDPDRNYKISFDRDEGKFSYTYKSKSESHPLAKGVLDRLSVTLAVLSKLQQDKNFTSITVQAIDGKKTQEIVFNNHGSEPIETGLGTFDALRIHKDRESSNRETVIWLARPEHSGPYIPVKIEQFRHKNLTMRLVITHFSTVE